MVYTIDTTNNEVLRASRTLLSAIRAYEQFAVARRSRKSLAIVTLEVEHKKGQIVPEDLITERLE